MAVIVEPIVKTVMEQQYYITFENDTDTDVQIEHNLGVPYIYVDVIPVKPEA